MSTEKRTGRAPQPSTRVIFEVPPGACDCHTHIHGDPERFPFFAGRVYTPEPALPSEMSALHRALGIQRVVIVTPSVYGTDNAASLYGMQARGADARGVAVIDDSTTESELDAMHRTVCAGSASTWRPAASTTSRPAATASAPAPTGWRDAAGTSRSTRRCR